MDEDLRAIYADRDGSVPDLTRLERSEGSRVTRFLLGTLGVLILVSAVSWAGFFVWSNGWFDGADPLTAHIEGPLEARAGEPVTYVIRYTNTGRVPLAALDATLHAPPHFRILSRTPEPTDGLTWNLGSLGAASDGALTITGVFRSEVLAPDGRPEPPPQTLQAFFTYKPANFSSEFQHIETAPVRVAASILEIDVDGPEKALAGEETTYHVRVRNTSSVSTDPVQVFVNVPDGFNVSETDPAPSAEDRPVWDLSALDAEEEVEITVTGRYVSSASGDQRVSADVSFLDGSTPLRQAAASIVTDVLRGAISLHAAVNGSSQSQTIDLGRTLRVSVSYANTGSDTVEGLRLSLAGTGADGKPLPIDWARADIGSNAARSGGTVTWTGTSEPALARLLPGAEGTFDLTLPVVSTLDPARVADQFALQLTATFTRVGSVTGTRVVETSPITVGVNSEFRVDATARYFAPDGEEVGTGPVPPQVGETTSYRIYWNLANALHDLTGVRVSAQLPPDVRWAGRTGADVGSVSFDETTRTAVWTIPALPRTVARAEAHFDVTITPSPADAGSFFKLTNAVSAEAVDAATRERLSRSRDVLTTELSAEQGALSGVVVE